MATRGCILLEVKWEELDLDSTSPLYLVLCNEDHLQNCAACLSNQRKFKNKFLHFFVVLLVKPNTL